MACSGQKTTAVATAGNGNVVHLNFRKRQRHVRTSSGSRAASAASVSASTPAVLAGPDSSTANHHSAGIRSRWYHLRAAATPAPISVAMLSGAGDGQSSIIERKEENGAPMRAFLGQLVLKGKANVSHDCGGRIGLNVAVAKTQSAAAFLEDFLARVKSAREAAGYTQDELASLLCISQDLYSKYEVRSFLPHYLVPKFCTACRVDAVWLFTEKGKGPTVVKAQRGVARRRRGSGKDKAKVA